MENPPFEAILFDMDGVIINTEEAVTAFWEMLAAECGVILTPQDYTRHVYGCSARHTFEVLFTMLDEPARQVVLERAAQYEMDQTYIPVEGTLDLLHALKAHHIPTALVTSGAMWKVNTVTEQLGLAGLFAAIVTSDDISHSKPHPEGYLTGARKLGKTPQRCIVFEDALSGVEAARAAGAACVGVNRAAQAEALCQAGACCVIPTLAAARLERTPAGLSLALAGSGTLWLAG